MSDNIYSVGNGIVIERNNMTFDGQGFTIQVAYGSGVEGMWITGRTNVSMLNTQFYNCWIAVQVESSFNIAVVGNNFSENNNGVIQYSCRNSEIVGNRITGEGYSTGIVLNNVLNSSISDNYIVGAVDNAISLSSAPNNTISGNTITGRIDSQGETDSYEGISLYNSSSNDISGNNITNCMDGGIRIDLSSNDTISENNETFNLDQNTDECFEIKLHYCSNIDVIRNNLSGPYSGGGMYLYDTNSSTFLYNRIFGGTVSECLIASSSPNCTFLGNDISNAYRGPCIYSSDYTVFLKNIVHDNDGYGVQCQGSNHCIFMENSIIANVGEGMRFEGSSNDNVSGNNIANNWIGIDLVSASGTSVSENNITANSGDGVVLASSSNNIVNGNNVTANGGAGYGGLWLVSSSNNTLSGNSMTANYNYGVLLEISPYNSVSGNNVSNNYYGVWLASSYCNASGNSVTDNAEGIWLDGYSNNSINGNNVANNEKGIDLGYTSGDNISGNNVTENADGIYLLYSNYNIVSGNSVTANMDGVCLFSSFNNSIFRNNMTENTGDGIYLDSNNNRICENDITNNCDGIYLSSASNNSIRGNTIADNYQWGITYEVSCNNTVYHNNFINNGEQAKFYSPNHNNVWDDSYPSGGNYWSNYTGIDNYRGPYQNETGSDGIGDTAYTMDSDNIDNYPFMSPWSMADIAVTNITSSRTVVGQGYDLNVTVTASNPGSYQETFTLTVNVSIFIAPQNVTLSFTMSQNVTLPNKNLLDITFTINTVGYPYGNYNVSAYAWPFSGETNTANNNFTDGTVHVSVPGDIKYDGTVNILDAILLAAHYNEHQPWPHPTIDPNVDIKSDGIINILDAIILSNHYLQHYP